MTSSGERFDKEALTAAHLSLPFGTLVRVKNLDNDSAVVVRITDRGPFGRGRILDVSEAGARALGIVTRGVCRVSMEVLPAAEPDFRESLPCFEESDLPTLTPIALELPQDHYYFLQVGAYADLAHAEEVVRALQQRHPAMRALVSATTVDGQMLYRVLAGRFTDRFEATLVRDRLLAAGLKADVNEMVLADG